MKLHFITSLSKDYWESVGKYCIKTWNLPGKVTIYVEQLSGDITWIKDLPFKVELVKVPSLKIDDEFIDRKKILKFWGKACAQQTAVKNRGTDERIIWIDADVEQIGPVIEEDFNFYFEEPIAMMNSFDKEDCWETGLVIFNQRNEKLGQLMKKYDQAWKDDEILSSLWKPYDAQVLGYVAIDRTFFNLCKNPCKNEVALANSIFGSKFKHWINKDNKQILQKQNESSNSSDLS
jgi:hypothetical protein